MTAPDAQKDCFELFFNNQKYSEDEISIISQTIVDHNIGNINFLNLVNDARFSTLTGVSFFLGQHMICKIIPELSARPADMMLFVRALVEKGGHDLGQRLINP